MELLLNIVIYNKALIPKIGMWFFSKDIKKKERPKVYLEIWKWNLEEEGKILVEKTVHFH